MPAYDKLIDAETWAFIEKTNRFYPPDTTDLDIGAQRAIYDRMCRAFFAGYPDGVSAETTGIEAEGRTIPVRIYGRRDPDNGAVILYFHGGGFILGGLESHDDVCAELCGRTGYAVVSVDYRLSPEHAHPAAFEDAIAAFAWVSDTYKCRVVLAGDSAGGNLAAAVAHASRRLATRPAGQVLIYPGLGGDLTRGSYVEHADAPMLSARNVAYYSEVRAAGQDVSNDPSFAPLADGDFSGLPPTVAVTAQCDPLSSDGETYRDSILAAGGKAIWFEEAGLVHGYLRARHSVTRARESFTRIVEAVRALGKGDWPY